MDIISINKFVNFNSDIDLFDLVNPNIVYLNNLSISGENINYKNITVEEYHEMRIDLLFKDMYDLEPNEVGVYLGNIDIICTINNIDNPLNIKKGMVLKYPEINDFDKYRFTDDSFNRENDVKSKLVVPNKSTKKDSEREKFKESGYSLPPVVLDKPKPPVRIEGNKFTIGGL